MRNTCTASYQSLKASFHLLLQKIILIVSRLDNLDDPEAPAAQPQPSATTAAAAARNLDWAKIFVVYCLSTGVSMALIHTQVHPSKLPLSFLFLGLAVLLAFACIMSLKASFLSLLQKIKPIVSRLHDPGDLEAQAPAAAARNLDWAKIVVVYSLSTGVTLALIRTQVHPSKLPLSFFFLGLAILLAFACIMILQLVKFLITSPLDHDAYDPNLDDPEAALQVAEAAAAAAYSYRDRRRRRNKKNNLDWAKIIVVFCFTAAIGLALLPLQLHDSHELPLNFNFLGLTVLLAFTCILVSKFVHFNYCPAGISISYLFHNVGLFFGFTAFLISITILFPLWFKCTAYSIYVAAYFLIILCNLHFNKYYKPHYLKHPNPENFENNIVVNDPAVLESSSSSS
ncbi:hypothetical protein ACE6H2_018796 [Prunus campanulata]